jgi:hypothetical protein
VLKIKEISILEKTWGTPKCILLSKRSQSEKAAHMTFMKRGRIIETVKRLVVVTV